MLNPSLKIANTTDIPTASFYIHICILTTNGQLKSTNKLIDINYTCFISQTRTNNLESILQVSRGHFGHYTQFQDLS